jgi:hypothetical protein
MLKLVLLAAVASMCLVPAYWTADRSPWSGVLLFGGGLAPPVVAGVALVLYRKGRLRDWCIGALLTVSVGLAFGFALFVFVTVTYEILRRGVSGNVLQFFGLSALAAVGFGFALWFLGRRVVPKWCPECRFPTMLLEPVRRSSTPLDLDAIFQCVRCGQRFARQRG